MRSVFLFLLWLPVLLFVLIVDAVSS